jgi:hypothetical protein
VSSKFSLIFVTNAKRQAGFRASRKKFLEIRERHLAKIRNCPVGFRVQQVFGAAIAAHTETPYPRSSGGNDFGDGVLYDV